MVTFGDVMKITVRDIDDISVLTISGRIDSISSNDLEMVLERSMNKSHSIIIDLADTEYISSSGLRVLLAGLKALKSKQGDMILASLQPVVRDVFEIAGLTRLFSIQKDPDDALHILKSRR